MSVGGDAERLLAGLAESGAQWPGRRWEPHRMHEETSRHKTHWGTVLTVTPGVPPQDYREAHPNAKRHREDLMGNLRLVLWTRRIPENLGPAVL